MNDKEHRKKLIRYVILPWIALFLLQLTIIGIPIQYIILQNWFQTKMHRVQARPKTSIRLYCNNSIKTQTNHTTMTQTMAVTGVKQTRQVPFFIRTSVMSFN